MNRLSAIGARPSAHTFVPTRPTPVNIISDRHGRHAVTGQNVKVKRGWSAVVVAQCHCGCRQYRVTVLNLIDVIVPVDILRLPKGSPAEAAA